MVMVFFSASTAFTTAPKYHRPAAWMLRAVFGIHELLRVTLAPAGSPASLPGLPSTLMLASCRHDEGGLAPAVGDRERAALRIHRLHDAVTTVGSVSSASPLLAVTGCVLRRLIGRLLGGAFSCSAWSAGLSASTCCASAAAPAPRTASDHQHRRGDLELGQQHGLQHSFCQSDGLGRDHARGRRLPRRKEACGLDRSGRHRGRHARRRHALRQHRRQRRARHGQAAPASRFASIARAVASRLATVPSGKPKCRAASLRVLPSRSHRTMTARYLSGRRLSSWSSSGCRSSQSSVLLEGWFGHGRHLLLPRPPPGGRRSRLQRRLVGHAVEPVGDHLPRHDGSRLADEDEEGGLEGVLGVVVAVEDPAADAPDHRAVPLHQGGERRFLAAAEVALQQLPIGQARPLVHEGWPLRRVWMTRLSWLVAIGFALVLRPLLLLPDGAWIDRSFLGRPIWDSFDGSPPPRLGRFRNVGHISQWRIELCQFSRMRFIFHSTNIASIE